MDRKSTKILNDRESMKTPVICFCFFLVLEFIAFDPISPGIFAQSRVDSLIEQFKKNHPRGDRVGPQRTVIVENEPIPSIPGPHSMSFREEGIYGGNARDTWNTPNARNTEIPGASPPFLVNPGITQSGYEQGQYQPSDSDSEFGNVFPLHLELRRDARLNDLCFVDSQRGWTVGDHGLILRTVDGGRTWIPQNTPVKSPLKSVSFCDEQNGIAVGGFTRPFLQTGYGVVLKTSNAGESWVQVSASNLPKFTRVHLENPNQGWALGEFCEESPSGLFRTEDGGKTWAPYPLIGLEKTHWADFQFLDQLTGVGIPFEGKPLFMQGIPGISESPDPGIRRLKSVEIFHAHPQSGSPNGWMVGEGGLVFHTLNMGTSWNPIPGPYAQGKDTLFDFRTVFARDRNVWIAGSPGSRIFCSRDAGRTWISAATGCSVPLRKIQFTDPENGFAVGDLGTILATNDGGMSWNIQRSGGSRVAILGVFSRPEEIPLELFTLYGAEQGYCSVVELPFRCDEQSDPSFEDRVHQALIRCGSNGSHHFWGFPLDREESGISVESLVQRLEKENNGTGLQRFRKELVGMIRKWRPNILLSSDPGTKGESARTFLTRELHDAVHFAADPNAFPEQIREGGLSPWKVDKMFHVLEKGQSGEIHISCNELAVRLGESLREMSFESRGLLETRPNHWSKTHELNPVLNNRSTFAQTRNDLMSGIVLAPGSEARRIPQNPISETLQSQQRRANRRNQVIELCEKHAKNAKSGEISTENDLPNMNFHAVVRELVREMEPEYAVRTLMETGLRFQQHGDWESARSSFSAMVEMYPKYPLSAYAMKWLIQYNSSREMQWRMQRKRILDSCENSVPDIDASKIIEEERLKFFRFDQVHQCTQLLKKYAPKELLRPEMRFALSVLEREKESDEPRFPLSGSPVDSDLWMKRIHGEHWISRRFGNARKTSGDHETCPLPVLVAKIAPDRPYLDGVFDREHDRDVWLNAGVVALTSKTEKLQNAQGNPELHRSSEDHGISPSPYSLVSANTPYRNAEIPGVRDVFGTLQKTKAESKSLGTQCMFLYDEDCLYVAFRCRKSNRFSYPPSEESPRPRDADLRLQDRIEILFDTDRDFGISHKITIDHRGWLRDECGEDPHWNPAIFIATHEEQHHWIIEAAIPLESLGETAPESGAIWGIGLRRIVPGEGIECWNPENSENLTRGFGYLLFE